MYAFCDSCCVSVALTFVFSSSNDVGGVDEERTEDIREGCAGGAWAIEC